MKLVAKIEENELDLSEILRCKDNGAHKVEFKKEKIVFRNFVLMKRTCVCVCVSRHCPKPNYQKCKSREYFRPVVPSDKKKCFTCNHNTRVASGSRTNENFFFVNNCSTYATSSHTVSLSLSFIAFDDNFLDLPFRRFAHPNLSIKSIENTFSAGIFRVQHFRLHRIRRLR